MEAGLRLASKFIELLGLSIYGFDCVFMFPFIKAAVQHCSNLAHASVLCVNVKQMCLQHACNAYQKLTTEYYEQQVWFRDGFLSCFFFLDI